MFNPQPKVSLGIPVYSGEFFLEACLIPKLIRDCFIGSEMVVPRTYDRPSSRSQVAVVR